MNITLNLRKQLIRVHESKRRGRIMGLVKEQVARFAKIDPEKIRIHKDVNQFFAKNASGASYMWARLKVNVDKDQDKALVRLPTTKIESVESTKKTEMKEKKAEAAVKKTETTAKEKAPNEKSKQQKQA